MKHTKRLIPMKFVSPGALRRFDARARMLFTVAAEVLRLLFRKESAGIRERRYVGCWDFNGLLARIALLALICQVTPRCAAAEAALVPQAAAATTNLAGSDAADLAWKQLQKALRPPAPPERQVDVTAGDRLGEPQREQHRASVPPPAPGRGPTLAP